MPDLPDLAVQFLGFVALCVGVGWGYWHWLHSRPALGSHNKLLLILFVGTLVGGLIGSTGWWIRDPRSFSWLLPPLASRMLAAAGWSFAFAAFSALQHPVYRRVRLALWMLTTYFVPLAFAIVFFHMNRFNFAAPITYVFFIIVTVITVLALWFLFRQPRIDAGEPKDTAPANVLTRSWLIVVAAVMAVWGAALFLTDAGPSDLIWVWPGDLLSSRLISVMLLTIAVGALYGAGFADTAQIMLCILIIYGAGVTVANLWNALSNRPIKVSYVTVFAVIAFVSAALLIRTRRDRKEGITR